jgi:capping protein alpha
LCNTVFAEVGGEELSVTIGITSKNINIGKSFAAEWISTWNVSPSKIKGEVSIKSHYFEIGNVQLNQKREMNEKFEFGRTMEETAKSIVRTIEKFETQVQETLRIVYDEMQNNFFKKLRKYAPYTKTRMTWNFNSLKMNQNLHLLNANKPH